jgi:multisubunit Na+/H+ antiporter MnhF subunit
VGAYAELLSFFNTMAYARHLKLDLSVYGETVLISFQNLIVVLTIFYYEKKVKLHEKMLVLGLFGLYATVLLADENLTN